MQVARSAPLIGFSCIEFHIARGVGDVKTASMTVISTSTKPALEISRSSPAGVEISSQVGRGNVARTRSGSAAIIGPICSRTSALSSGPRHTAVPRKPPGRSTRAASRQPAARSGNRKIPNEEKTASKEPLSNESA
ncbi:MAG: hypothetical protein U0271_47140 [Polyangiaceae bacterium]